jgi:uncharacterized protein YlxW (UPF0749 family)
VPEDKATGASAPSAPAADGGARDDPHQVRQRRIVRICAIAVIALLTGLLGFAIVVQVHQNSSTDNLANLREDDLVGILDNQNARADRLRQQITDLQQTLRRLQDSGDRSAAARQQAQQEAQALGVLLGTLPAAGPGIAVHVTDPTHKLGAEDLLDIVEELRGAGAEAIQFGTVRVSTTTAFTDVHGAAGATVAVDATALTQPYDVLAIGDPKTLDTALNIPGGVAAAIRNAGGDLTVSERSKLTIAVTRSLPVPKYARPPGH